MSQIIRIDLNGVNSYLAKYENGFILFDTGGHIVMDQQFTNRRELLLQGLEKAGCTADSLKLIVLTHGDNDHSCNAAYLREHFNTQNRHARQRQGISRNPNIAKIDGKLSI